MKRLIGIFIVLLLAIQVFGQFGVLDKVKKGKDVADKAKKVGEAIRPINEKEEYFIGRAVAAQILSKYTLLKNAALTNYISLLGNYLALSSERPQIYDGYRFAVLDSDEINAFAAPGGFVFLTRGLIRACNSEDELAAVMAHEVSHIVRKDPVNAISKNRLKSLFSMAADEVAKGGPGAVSLLKDTVGDITGTLLLKGYSRGQEKDADLAALVLLGQCGYARGALLTVLHSMEPYETKKSKAFSAHPRAKDRCEYVGKSLKGQNAGAVNAERTARFKAALKSAGL